MNDLLTLLQQPAFMSVLGVIAMLYTGGGHRASQLCTMTRRHTIKPWHKLLADPQHPDSQSLSHTHALPSGDSARDGNSSTGDICLLLGFKLAVLFVMSPATMGSSVIAACISLCSDCRYLRFLALTPHALTTKYLLSTVCIMYQR